ncbi:MAG: two-component regulator propeller domain-containing protein, partial [Maribacter sp.]
MSKKLTYLFLFLLCISTNHILAQNTQLRPYTIEDGLPQSQVYDIIQDEIGYLWLGTQGGGVANFDGKTFQVWNESNGLASNYIHSLYFANDSLFIGSKRGLSIKVKDRISNFEGPQINQFYVVGDKKYLATQKGVYLFSKARGLQKISILPEIDNSNINALYFGNSLFWVATNNGLWKLKELDSSATGKTKLETDNFTSIIYHDEKIFAATFNDGIRVIDAKNHDNTLLIREPQSINSMSIQNKSELWVATQNDGVVVIDTENYEEIRRIDTRNGLSIPHIRKTVSDKNSNLWIATSGGGFYKYFQNNFNHYDKDSGLKGDRTYAVHEAKDGLWISSSEAGLTKIDSLGIHYIPKTKDFSNVKVKTIASDKNGNIWAGSDGMGLLFKETKKVDSIVTTFTDSLEVEIDTLSKTLIKNHILNTETGFPADWIRKIIIDNDFVWVATYADGIVKFNYYPESDSLVIRKTFGKQSGISDLLLIDMATDGNGRIWYATKTGDLGYIENDKVTNLPSVLNQQTSIGTLLFHQNHLFLGTAGRGIWYSEVSESLAFQKLKGAKELSSDNIYQLIFDDQGYLWAGTERGVDKIEIDQSNEIVDIHHFGRNDGFLAIETCLNAVEKDAKGNLWFGGIYGLTQYTPGENEVQTKKPKIRFEAVEIDYQVLDSIEPNIWAKSKKILQLNPNQTQLAFSYKTVDIDHPNGVQYRTKLNETEWGPWSSENRQNLVGLAYGPHQFSVQARNYRWQESDAIGFSFHIDSPLYKKSWFQWAMLALVVLFLAVISLMYIRRIKAKNRKAQEQL